MQARTFPVSEFARMAGVTVRTLHYYDQTGLLRPHRRGSVRQYRQHDMLRLQQILTLKYLGFSLDEIRDLLANPAYNLRESLSMQRDALHTQIEQLQKAARALELTLAHLEATDSVDWSQINAIIDAIQHDAKEDWLRKYLSDSQIAGVLARGYPVEAAEQGTRDWERLIDQFKALRHLPPDHPDVQVLAAEYVRLVESFTQGNAELENSLREMYSDMSNIPEQFRLYDNDLRDYMQVACAIYKGEHP